jgi:TRAP-type C4-dicarboxylate transport system permease small subunit
MEAMISCFLLVFNMLLIVANIILRRFFNSPIFGSTELVRYLSLCAASFALSDNEWVDGNVNMTLLLEMMSNKTRDIMVFLGNVFCAVSFVLISYLLIIQAISKYTKGDITTELGIPIWIPASILAFGFVVLTLMIAIKSVILGWALKTGEKIDFRNIEPVSDDEKVLE